jgi:hypothetical protein
MDKQNPSPDAATPSRPRPTVDDFVTWSEIEQKIQQVARPEARQEARAPASSNYWRWGWVVAPILFGLFRLIGSGARHNEPPPYVPPRQQFDQRQLERMMQEAQRPDVNAPRPFEGALEEFQKGRNQQEPVGPQKP